MIISTCVNNKYRPIFVCSDAIFCGDRFAEYLYFAVRTKQLRTFLRCAYVTSRYDTYGSTVHTSISIRPYTRTKRSYLQPNRRLGQHKYTANAYTHHDEA